MQNRRAYIRGLAALLALIVAPMAGEAGEDIGKADRILVLKEQRVLILLREGTVLDSFAIGLGFHPRGAKRRLGDGKTPEGTYVIDRRTSHTPYHLALHISYPNAGDRFSAEAAQASPGGSIWIHGMPSAYATKGPVRFIKDWTSGCIAVGNSAIEEIWNAVEDGTPIEIRPR